ncbi:hypothetical protein LX36DRAFT_693759 [Colletotrichum falcatum]|nr:hypothetical protein LX36DRAFT_693759 [Colletotrichum falcatum]
MSSQQHEHPTTSVPGGPYYFKIFHVRCHAAPAAPDQNRSYPTDSLVVAVQGVCPPGQPPTKSPLGVYFGVKNIVKRVCRIPDVADRGHVMLDTDGSDSLDRPQHTQQRADLYAAIAGLFEAGRLVLQGPPPELRPLKLHHIVCKSDSAYLVEGTAKGDKVKNENLWDNLMLIILMLGKKGVAVEFWHVPKREDRDAERLAKYALESSNVQRFDENLMFGKTEHKRENKNTPQTAKDEPAATE